MSSRGAAKPPLSYEGTYDATRTYLPREVVKYAGVAYMATAKVTGVLPTVAASWLPLGGGGGGAALLGVVGIYTATATVTSNGGRIHFSSGPTIDTSNVYGDHGMSVAGGDIIYNVGGTKDGFYQATLVYSISSTTNNVSSDVHQFMWEDGLFGKAPVAFVDGGNVPAQVVTVSAGAAFLFEADYEPRLSAYCTGGTNRTYSVSAYLTVARWALPA